MLNSYKYSLLPKAFSTRFSAKRLYEKNKAKNIKKLFFIFTPAKAPQCGRPHNNGLYRSGLDPLSATNLCYTKIFLSEILFPFILFIKRDLSFPEATFPIFCELF